MSDNGVSECAISVSELEIADGVPALSIPTPGAALRTLLRYRGRPVGWVKVDTPEATVSTDVIRWALYDHAWALWHAGLTDRLEVGLRFPTPAVTVVVCTRDRPQQLDECLRALTAVDYPAYEVVVVDNASRSDETSRVAERWGVRYAREERPGLDWARNHGIAEARHELIAFTDDDVRVDSGWLRGLVRAFADPAVAMVTGLVAPAELVTEAQCLFELSYGGMGKGMYRWWWHGDALPKHKLVTVQHLGVGANMAFRRSLLESVGGFDTALDVGTPSHGAGDLDMFHRVLLTGAVACYEPTALVWHQHRRDQAGLRRQLYDNGRAFGVYLLLVFWRGAVSRTTVMRVAVGWLHWLVGRVVRRVFGRPELPLRYILAELSGATHAPWALVSTYWRDRRLRRLTQP